MKLTQEQMTAKLAELESEHKKVKEAADRVPQLEQELGEANDKVASLNKQIEENEKTASEKAPAISEELALKTAGLLVDRGLLKSEQKEAFASQIAEDPSQLCDSIEKIAEFAAATQMGEASNDDSALKVAEELDPIAKFALS